MLLSSIKNSDKYLVNFVSLKGGLLFLFNANAYMHIPKQLRD